MIYRFFILLQLLGLSAYATENCDQLYREIYGTDAAENHMLTFTYGDLLEIPKRSPEETLRLNTAALQKLKSAPIPQTPGRKPVLTRDEILELYNRIANNKQVSESQCGAYNGSKKSIGFCFGRAFAAHLMALESRLDKRSIRKLWAVGDLEGEIDGETVSWGYHVTTIIRGEDGNWYALDPLMKQPVAAKTWVNLMSYNFDKGGTMRIYSTPADRDSVKSYYKYSPESLTHKSYRGFFIDLMNELKKERSR